MLAPSPARWQVNLPPGGAAAGTACPGNKPPQRDGEAGVRKAGQRGAVLEQVHPPPEAGPGPERSPRVSDSAGVTALPLDREDGRDSPTAIAAAMNAAHGEAAPHKCTPHPRSSPPGRGLPVRAAPTRSSGPACRADLPGAVAAMASQSSELRAGELRLHPTVCPVAWRPWDAASPGTAALSVPNGARHHLRAGCAAETLRTWEEPRERPHTAGAPTSPASPLRTGDRLTQRVAPPHRRGGLNGGRPCRLCGRGPWWLRWPAG